MQLTIQIDEEKIVREIYRNFPEMCARSRYHCITEDNNDFLFLFRDDDSGEEHEITLEKALEGFRNFVTAIHRGELFELCDLNTDTVQDPESWECIDMDYLIQFTIEGELVEP